nr:hypothetical protein BaRGS_032073 [Batillaria attramentaria]
MDQYLKVNSDYCCWATVTLDSYTTLNVTPALLTQAKESTSPAWLTCNAAVEHGVNGTVDDDLENVTVHDLSNATLEWQSKATLLTEYLGEKHVSMAVVVLLTSLYTIIFLTGVLGNVCTCIVIARNRTMHTATNYYLFSLAISDVLTLLLGEYFAHFFFSQIKKKERKEKTYKETKKHTS